MRTIIRLVLLVTLVSLASIAESAEWKLYFTNTRAQEFLIDTSSIVHLKNRNVRAWEKLVFPDITNGSLTLYEFNCTERKYTVRKIDSWGSNVSTSTLAMNSTIEESWRNPQQQWNYIDTSQLDEARYNNWCVIKHVSKSEHGNKKATPSKK